MSVHTSLIGIIAQSFINVKNLNFKLNRWPSVYNIVNLVREIFKGKVSRNLARGSLLGTRK